MQCDHNLKWDLDISIRIPIEPTAVGVSLGSYEHATVLDFRSNHKQDGATYSLLALTGPFGTILFAVVLKVQSTGFAGFSLTLQRY